MNDTAKQYIDLYTQHRQTVCTLAPAVMNSLRDHAADCLASNGLPAVTAEDWQHTDLPALLAADYGLNLQRLPIPTDVAAAAFRCDVPQLDTLHCTVVNDTVQPTPDAPLPHGVYIGPFGPFAQRHPDIAQRYYGQAADLETDPIAALNTMLVQDAFVIYVPAGVRIERPIQLVNLFRSKVDLMALRRILVIMEPRSEARLLVCDHSSSNSIRQLAAQVVEIFAADDALFDYYDLEESSPDTIRLASLYVKQGARSNVLVNGITLYGGITRNNYRVKLDGEGAESFLCGMAVEHDSQRVDTYTHITHAVPHCTSTQLFRNVLGGHSVGAFSGRIVVAQDAQKTMAYQTNRNMCTSPDARMYSKPQLEIYADDVKCSHGMTTGQLDEQALLYMRSRGIPEAEARLMLSVAFTADVLDHVRLEPLRDRLRQLVEKRFRGERSHCSACHHAR